LELKVAFAENEALLSDYNQWVAERKVVGVDTTPGAYLVDKAKESAYEKVELCLTYLSDAEWDESDALHVGALFEILEG
jgi:predicted nucleic acid-binding protein